MIWTAGNTFETKSDHDRDMESERRYLHEYIKRTADESADKAVEKWIIRRGK
jgi:transposase